MGILAVWKLIFTGPSEVEQAHVKNEEACRKLLSCIKSEKLARALERSNVHVHESPKVVKMSG